MTSIAIGNGASVGGFSGVSVIPGVEVNVGEGVSVTVGLGVGERVGRRVEVSLGRRVTVAGMTRVGRRERWGAVASPQATRDRPSSSVKMAAVILGMEKSSAQGRAGMQGQISIKSRRQGLQAGRSA